MPKNNKYIPISVIISTLNRCNFLQNAVASIQNQTISPGSYEIIVVDNGSTDGTRKLIKRFNRDGKKHIRYVYEPALGLTYARHAGIRAARGDILVFTDDDATFSSECLKAYFDAFTKHPDMEAAGGPVRPLWEKPPPKWLTDYIGDKKRFTPLSLMEPYQEFTLSEKVYFFGVNMAVRKRVFRNTGFHPELIGGWTIGDGEAGLKKDIVKLGGLIGYIPEAVAYHHIPSSRMSVRAIRKWAWHCGGTIMYERWRNRKRKIRSLVGEAVFIFRQYRSIWLRDCLVRNRKDPEAINIQFQASLGWCKFNYVFWMLTNSKVQAALDMKDFRP